MTTALRDHPLQETLGKVTQLSKYLKAGLGNTDDTAWLTPLTLLAADSPHWTTLLATTQQRLHTEAATIVSGSLLQEYQWPLLASAIACFLVDRRVPDLQPANVQLRLGLTENADDQRERLTYRTGRFAALPDDPAADHPDAEIVPDLAALRDYLRTGIETHMGWVIQQVSRQTHCKERGLWLFVADRCAGTLVWLMQEQDQQPGCADIAAEINALIRADGSPLANKKVGLFELSYQKQTHIYLNRATCCYWYKTDGGDYCTTCPHRTKEDRNERLLQAMTAMDEKSG